MINPARIDPYCTQVRVESSGDIWIAHRDLRLRIVGGRRVSTSAAIGVGWESTTGAQGFYVELGVLPVLGSEIGAQSNLLVRLDDFLGN